MKILNQQQQHQILDSLVFFVLMSSIQQPPHLFNDIAWKNTRHINCAEQGTNFLLDIS